MEAYISNRFGEIESINLSPEIVTPKLLASVVSSNDDEQDFQENY